MHTVYEFIQRFLSIEHHSHLSPFSFLHYLYLFFKKKKMTDRGRAVYDRTGSETQCHTRHWRRELSLWKTHGTRTFLFGVHEHDRAAAEKWLVSKRCWTLDGDVSSRRKRAHFTGLSSALTCSNISRRRKGQPLLTRPVGSSCDA